MGRSWRWQWVVIRSNHWNFLRRRKVWKLSKSRSLNLKINCMNSCYMSCISFMQFRHESMIYRPGLFGNYYVMNYNQERSFSVTQSSDILNPYRCFGVISVLSSLNSLWKATMNNLQNWRIQNHFIRPYRLQRRCYVFLADFQGGQNDKSLSLLPIKGDLSVLAGNPMPEVYLMIPRIFTYNSFTFFTLMTS